MNFHGSNWLFNDHDKQISPIIPIIFIDIVSTKTFCIDFKFLGVIRIV